MTASLSKGQIGVYLSTLLVSASLWAQPFSGGPRVPSILLMLVGIFLLVNRKMTINDQRFQRFVIINLLLFIPALLSLINTYSYEDSSELIVVLPFFIPVAAGILYLIDKKVSLKIFYSIILIVCAFWVIDGIIQLITGQDVFGVTPWRDTERITGPFTHLRLSLFLSITIPLVLFRLRNNSWLWQVLYLTFALFVIMLSGVRTDLLTSLIAITFYIIVNKKFKMMLAIIPVLLIAGFLATNNSSISDAKLKSFESLPHTYQEWNSLSSNRLEIWSAAWNMVLDNPAFGVGAKSFEHAYDDYAPENNRLDSKTVSHAHHPIISVAAETGIVGLFGLFTVLFLLYKWGRDALKNKLLANPWFQILILMFFPIQSMPLLFTLWWFPFVVMVMLFYLNDLHKRNNQPTVPNELSDNR